MNPYRENARVVKPSRLESMLYHVVSCIIVLTGCTMLLMISYCTPAQPVITATAETTYYAEQMACVDRYETKEAIDKCRDEVKARWARDAAKETSNE